VVCSQAVHLESGFDGLERPATFLHGPGQAGHVVVCERGHVELEHLHILRQNVSRRARLLVSDQLVVGLTYNGNYYTSY
jgi:hypothetical protein